MKTTDKYGRSLMKQKIAFAIIHTKRKAGSGMPIWNSRLPIYWIKSTARKEAKEWGDDYVVLPVTINLV